MLQIHKGFALMVLIVLTNVSTSMVIVTVISVPFCSVEIVIPRKFFSPQYHRHTVKNIYANPTIDVDVMEIKKNKNIKA